MRNGAASAVGSAAAHGRLRAFAREPLVHFVVVGLALFAVATLHQRRVSLYRIVVTPHHVEQLAEQYRMQFGSPPDAHTLSQLVARDVHDEILYRQGLALQLDRDDQIVRRRLVQKMGFLQQDRAAPAKPGAAELAAYYQAHAARYVTPPRATFSHVYFATDSGADAARRRAAGALRTLSDATDRAPDRGDPFPDLYDFAAYEPEQVERLFGHTPMARAVFTAPVGRWAGPYRSGYGWHLIRVSARQAATRPALSAVRGRVQADYLASARERANEAAFDALARRFTVVRDDIGTAR